METCGGGGMFAGRGQRHPPSTHTLPKSKPQEDCDAPTKQFQRLVFQNKSEQAGSPHLKNLKPRKGY